MNCFKRYFLFVIKRWRKTLFLHPQWKPHFNGKRLLCGATLKTIGWYCFGMLWIWVVLTIGESYITEILKDTINHSFEIANNYLAERWWLNAMITVTGFVAVSFWLIHVCKDRFLSLNRIVAGVCLMMILSYIGSFTKVYSFIKVDYASLFFYLFPIQIILDAIKLWYGRWSVKAPSRARPRYITELPKENLDEKVRLDYAIKVSEWLFNTDISESSFAVGITSEWGSGKTSFLLDLRKAVDGKCYMMDFRPWHCQTPDQIVNEFFELLRKSLKSVYSPLQKPIIRYAQLLSEVDLPSYVKPIFNILPDKRHSISEYKTKIEEGLKQLDKPVLVTIDDMDRLAAEELFEVLRLIRNTAAFPNLIFVVCYDKAYVVKQISNRGIDESDLYLEKIFPLELTLPKTEDEALIETFRKAMIGMHFMNGTHDSLRRKITTEDELIMVRLLPTFRKIKRFARALMTNTMFLMDKLGEKNVDLYDIFLIELLHFCMPDIYMLLRDTPEELLDVKFDDRTRQARYSLKSNYKEKLSDRPLGVYEDQLLSKCFGMRTGYKTHYIAFVDSYMNYFCLSTPDAQITKKEFADVVGARANVRRNVHNWFFKLPIKKSASLYSKLMGARINELSIEQWKDHICLVYSWMCEDDYEMIKDVLAHYLFKVIIHPNDEATIGEAKKYAMVKLETIIKSPQVKRYSIARTLCGYFDLIEKQESEFLINCDEIKKMLSYNFTLYMKEKQVQQDAINVVALNGNDLNAFVKTHDIAKRDDRFGDFSMIHKNLIIEDVISYFGAYKEKSSHKQDAMKIYELGRNRYKDSRDFNQNDLKEEKYSIFGDDTHYDEYLNKCFVG